MSYRRDQELHAGPGAIASIDGVSSIRRRIAARKAQKTHRRARLVSSLGLVPTRTMLAPKAPMTRYPTPPPPITTTAPFRRMTAISAPRLQVAGAAITSSGGGMSTLPGSTAVPIVGTVALPPSPPAPSGTSPSPGMTTAPDPGSSGGGGSGSTPQPVPPDVSQSPSTAPDDLPPGIADPLGSGDMTKTLLIAGAIGVGLWAIFRRR